MRTPLILGLLPGWWLGTEDFRRLTPLVSESQWDQLLQSSSFNGVNIVLPDGGDSNTSLGCAMVSTAVPYEGIEIVDYHHQRLAIVYSENSTLQDAIAWSLKEWLQCKGIEATFTDVQACAEIGLPCIYLDRLDNVSTNQLEPEDLVASKCIAACINGVLWVRKRCMNDPFFLELDAIPDLLRTIKSERKDFTYVTLSLEHPDQVERSSKLITMVAEQFLLHHYIHDEAVVEMDRVLKVARFRDSKKLDINL